MNFYKRHALFLLIPLVLLLLSSSASESHRNYSFGAARAVSAVDSAYYERKSVSGYIPVLIYHHFQNDIPSDLANTTITPDEFDEQLGFLDSSGYKSISFSELYKNAENGFPLPDKPFIITIDDGYTSNYEYAYPILKKYSMKAALFIVVSSVGKTPGRFPHFTWDEAVEMERSGHIEIYNHGMDHVNHAKMSEAELTKFVTSAQFIIDSKLGRKEPIVFSYPESDHSRVTQKILRDAGYKIQLTGLNGVISPDTDLTDVKRINVQHGMSGKDVLREINLQVSRAKRIAANKGR